MAGRGVVEVARGGASFIDSDLRAFPAVIDDSACLSISDLASPSNL